MSSLPLARRPLGRTGLTVTALGLGGAYLGYSPAGFSDDQATATVLAALGAGLRFIDTSPLYGESERRLGQALTAWQQQGGRRADLVLCTKTGTRTRPADYSFDGTLRSVEASLKLLQTDYLDVVLVHDPSPAGLEQALAPNGAFAALRRLRDEKTIRSIGLGVREHAHHQRCLAADAIEVSLTYLDFNLLYQSAWAGVLQPMAGAGRGVLNAMLLAGGLLSGAEPRVLAAGSKRRFAAEEVARAQALWEWARDRGVSLLALNLQYSLHRPEVSVTLVGAASPAEITADLAAAAAPLPAGIWAELGERFGIAPLPVK